MVVLLADEGVGDVDEGAEEEEHHGGPGEAECVRTDFGVAAFVLELVTSFHKDRAGETLV